MNRKLIVSALAASVLAIGSASATTSPIIFTVQVTVANSCTVAVSTLDFGTQTDLSAAIPGSTTGSVTCTGNSPVTVSFNTGLNGTTLGNPLRMKNGAANFISYKLYKEVGNVNVLGDGVTGSTVTIPITPTGSGTPDAFSVFGLTSTLQNPKPNGVYVDSVTATVNF